MALPTRSRISALRPISIPAAPGAGARAACAAVRSGWRLDMSSSYAVIRSGIIEHLLSGRLSLFDFGVYTVVHLQANFRTGIWRGSAPRILATSPRGASLRAVQRGLETLNEIGFLRSFHQRGLRGNYPVLIDKYDVRTGALKGMRLNAWKSESWEKPRYEVVAESVAQPGAENVAESAPSSVCSKQESVKQLPAVFSKPEVSVWGFLKIRPCGPESFRTLIESQWASRNGELVSVLIGETVDTWEAAEGQKLRRTPQLFRALAQLRRKEQASHEQASVEQFHPIRVLTAEEIPA